MDPQRIGQQGGPPGRAGRGVDAGPPARAGDRTRRLGSDLEQLLVRRYSFASPVPASLVRFAADMIAATRIDVVADFLPTFDLHDAREALAALADNEVLVLAARRTP